MSGNVADWILNDVVDAGFFSGPLRRQRQGADAVYFQKRC
jgi:hypothetical protein